MRGGGKGRWSVSDRIVHPGAMALASIAAEAHQRALAYIESVGFETEQINGQVIVRRKPATWAGAAPSRSPEVFITHIPADCYEDVLFPIFYSVGNLQEFRLMVEFSGSTRGIGYALYKDDSDVARCIGKLHRIPLGNHTIYVVKSTNICWLKISNIPVQPPEIYSFCCEHTEDIVKIFVKKDIRFYTAAVEYRTHKAAALARRCLKSLTSLHWNYTVKTEWGKQPIATEIINYQMEMAIGNDGSVITQYLTPYQNNNSRLNSITNDRALTFKQNVQTNEPYKYRESILREYDFNNPMRKPQLEVRSPKPILSSRYASNVTNKFATTPQQNLNWPVNNLGIKYNFSVNECSTRNNSDFNNSSAHNNSTVCNWSNQTYENGLGKNDTTSMCKNTHQNTSYSNSTISPFSLWDYFTLTKSEIITNANNCNDPLNNNYKNINNTYDVANSQSQDNKLFDVLNNISNLKI